MSRTPTELRYAKTHEWFREEDGGLTMGITDHAQDLLGDVVFVDLPEVGRRVVAGEALALIESVKAASDIHSPVNGEVIAVNAALGDAPGSINTDPYGAGWILRLRSNSPLAEAGLLDAGDYAALAASEAE